MQRDPFQRRKASDGNALPGRGVHTADWSGQKARSERLAYAFAGRGHIPGLSSYRLLLTLARAALIDQRDRWRCSSCSAAAENAVMFASRSVLPVSTVMASSSTPAIAMQLCPALSP